MSYSPPDDDPILNRITEEAKPRRFVSASELLTRTITTTYLIHKHIEVNTTGAIFGPSGGGKTFQALHLACCVATGTPWNGQAVQRGLVLYLAGEGHSGIIRRIKAWAKHHYMDADSMALLHVSKRTIDLDGAGLPDVIAEAQELAEAHGVPVALIIIDTLARHLGGDENSTKDMSAFIKAVDSLRGALTESVALVVHHTGHGEETRTRARGSSAFKAAMDFEIRCDAGLLTFTKMKDAEEPDPIEFKLVPVQIGTSDDGEPLTSCVVHFGERSERQQDAAYTAMERQAIRALITVSARFRAQKDGMIGALEGDWRDEFYRLRREEDPDVKQNALKISFRTVKTGKNGDRGLIGKGALRQINNTVILTREGHQREIERIISEANPATTVDGSQTVETSESTGEGIAVAGSAPYKGATGIPSLLPSLPPPPGEAWQAVELDL